MRKFASSVSAAAILACILGFAPSAGAAIVLATDRATMAGADSIDWGSLGPDHPGLPNPFTVTSAGGLDVAVANSENATTVVTQGTSWNGAFAPGDRVLWATNSAAQLTLDFGTLLESFGLQIHSTLWGPFTAKFEALDSLGNVIGSVIRDGISSNAGDDSAIFIGMVSDSPTTAFSGVRISLIAVPGDFYKSFGVNRADFTVAQAVAAPEPGALALAGVGILAIAGVRLGGKAVRRAG